MSPGSLGDEFAAQAEPSGDDIAALGTDAEAAVRVIEQCVAAHHAVELAYVDEAGRAEQLTVWPAFIRTSTAHHVVLWAMSPAQGHWLQLRLDRVRGARDTRERFTPSW